MSQHNTFIAVHISFSSPFFFACLSLKGSICLQDLQRVTEEVEEEIREVEKELERPM